MTYNGHKKAKPKQEKTQKINAIQQDSNTNLCNR